MFRTSAILLVLLGSLSTGCTTLRDRIAMRYGLPTSKEQGKQMNLALRRAKLPARDESEFQGYYALLHGPRAEERLAVRREPEAAGGEPVLAFPSRVELLRARAAAEELAFHAEPEKPVVVVQSHPDPAMEEMSKERAQFQARLERYEMEREAARYRWEASLLRMQSDQLRMQVASLDATWKDLSEKVARMESDRNRVRESMAKVEEEMEKARARAAELQAKWSRIAVAMPLSRQMGEAQ